MMFTIMRVFTYIVLVIAMICVSFRSLGAVTKLIHHAFNRLDHEVERIVEGE